MEGPECDISLEAPDEVISGLLGVLEARNVSLGVGESLALPERMGSWRLLAVRGGALWLAREDGSYLLEPMQAEAVPGCETLSLLPQESCEATVITLTGQAPEQFLKETAAQGGLLFPSGGGTVHGLFQTLLVQQSHGGAVPAALASGAAYETLSRLYCTGRDRAQVRARVPRVIGEAMALMQQEFAFLDGIGDLADRLGLTQEYLTRVFRKYVGVTPGKYLSRLRVERAKLLLCQPGNTVSFVSDACGFSNGNYFARVFRQVTGMNPSEYARAMGGAVPSSGSLPDSFYVL